MTTSPFAARRLPAASPRSRGVSAIACIAFLLGLAGCANVPAQGMVAEPTGSQADPAPKATAAAPAPKGMSAEVLYKLLVAEIAGQRGHLGLAVKDYLDAARMTHDPAVAERAVRIAVFARDQASALAAAKIWAESDPKNFDAQRVEAALLIRSGNVDEAVKKLQPLVAPPNDTEERFGKIGDMLARERDHARAIKVMERLTSPYQKNPHALFALAQLLARTGDTSRSLGELRKLLVVDPSNERAVIAVARLQQRENDTAGALDSLSKYLTANPKADDVRMTYARLLVDAHRYDDARRQFERLAERTPNDADVNYALGLLLLQTNRYDEAAKRFEKLISMGRRVEESYFYLGQIDELRKDDEGALAAYRKVTRGDNRLNAQIRVAVLLAKKGDLKGARAHLHGLRTDNLQEAVRVYRAEAELLAQHSRPDDAMKVYDAALEKYPKNTDLLYARAMLAAKLDKIAIVERDLRDILSREPNNADALNALGYTLADRTTRYHEALKLIERAYQLKPNDHYIIDSLGWVQYRLGHYRDAVKHLRRALKIKGDPEIAAHLGEVLWVMGDHAAAKKVWNTALEATPDDKKLLEVIKRFGP